MIDIPVGQHQNDSLSPLPRDGIDFHVMGARVAEAFEEFRSELSSEAQEAMSAALANEAPVGVICGAFDVLSANVNNIGPVLKSRAIECADLIVQWRFYGKAEEAKAFAESARASLAS